MKVTFDIAKGLLIIQAENHDEKLVNLYLRDAFQNGRNLSLLENNDADITKKIELKFD